MSVFQRQQSLSMSSQKDGSGTSRSVHHASHPSHASLSSSSSGGGGGWLGRVFGRGKGKEKEREPGPGESYYAENFYAQKRAEAEARAQVKEYLNEKGKK